MGAMEVMQLRPGLWRWTAPHPEWKPEKDKPGGWAEMVGCLYYEPPEQGRAEPTVLIDPLAPPDGSPDGGKFWEALDADLKRRDRAVAVLLGNHYHERSAQRILDRYAGRHPVTLWSHEAARARVACRVTDTFRGETILPGGVKALPVAGIEENETVFWLPPHRALVFSDALIGTGFGGTAPGRVFLAPASWAPGTPEGQDRYRREFRASMRRLLDLPVEMLLVSHGAPVLQSGRRALEEALDSPAWGD